MKKTNIQNIILIPLLIIGLVAFNLPLVSAEEGGSEGDQPATEEVVDEEGNQGNDTEASSVEDQGETDETVIETGDGEADVNMENEVNTNITDLSESEEEIEGEGEIEDTEDVASGSEGFEELATESEGFEDLASGSFEVGEQVASGSEDASVEVNNENEADIENEVKGEADTGENEANDNRGDAIIETGDATATANVSNMANTNLTGSNFWFNFSNLFQDLVGDINLNNFNNNNENDCGLIDCVDLLRVSNKNQGNIINDVEIYALTGDNSADGNNGNAYIRTGNARVVANIANLLNTNITGSDWFFSILNSFSNWYGNLVLPGKETIENILNGFGSSGNDVYVENNSQADVENNVNVIAETGNNSANNNDGDSCINTGQAEAKSNILNVINTNIFGDNWLVVGIKVFGKWAGEIHSLPDGVSWLRTPDGIILFNDDLADDLPLLFQEGEGDASLDIENDNEATLTNNVDITASTGNNSASNNNGSGTIETGNATAIANVVNFVNTNIIGRNWLFAMVNIFGNWQGNLAFGQPNLWLGESAITSPDPAEAGGTITYTLTYANNGDADATGVVIFDDFDERYLSVIDSGGGTVIDNPGEIWWDIGMVGIGESQSVSYSVAIDSQIPYGTTYLINRSEIDSFEDDANNEDNTDSLSIAASRPWPVLFYIPPTPPELQVTKTSNGTDVVYPSDVVTYTIVVTNPSQYTAYNVIVSDVLSNGEILNTYAWDLGVVYPNEEITIDYTVAIDSQAPAGFYTNTAEANGVDGFGNQVISTKASTTIEVKRVVEEGEVEQSEEGIEEESSEETEEEFIEEVVGEGVEIEEESSPEIFEEEIGIGLGIEEEPESLAQGISLTQEETSIEPGKEMPKRFFLAFVGDFFSNLGLIDLLILLLLVVIIFLVLFFLERKKLRKNN